MHIVELPILNTEESYTVSPSKIIALGLNYRSHINEHTTVNVPGFKHEVPSEPILFPKTPNVLIGTEEPIIIPAFLKEYNFKEIRVDYEAELAFIIKDKCKNILQNRAYEHILGFTCMNDVSQRNFQANDKSGWFRGKSLDTFGPLGPVLVRIEDIPDPQNLHIQCRLNGKIVQDANTREMIFSIPEIVAFISRQFTLLPGDIISTGTPKGVGPLHHGDLVEVEIEHIGILKNPVINEL